MNICYRHVCSHATGAWLAVAALVPGRSNDAGLAAFCPHGASLALSTMNLHRALP
ncbi:hypothetical protein [Polaromonas sp. SM01]|uniref:hypothetical protein n=1 Tax=Polaromonas sp. SM01 TaxID=3085630 RepID=UPI002980F355|nr:hypothetical protein [Polaromonas sp. SM01]